MASNYKIIEQCISRTMPRGKLKIKRIEDEIARRTSYVKREQSIIKKVLRLSAIGESDVGVNGRAEDVFLRFFETPANWRGHITAEEDLINGFKQVKIEGESIEKLTSFFVPDPNTINTVEEAEARERIILNAMQNVQNLREKLEHENNLATQAQTSAVPVQDNEESDLVAESDGVLGGDMGEPNVGEPANPNLKNA